MSDGQPIKQFHATYIETPHVVRQPEKTSSVLEKRMKALMRKWRRQLRREGT